VWLLKGERIAIFAIGATYYKCNRLCTMYIDHIYGFNAIFRIDGNVENISTFVCVMETQYVRTGTKCNGDAVRENRN
jgi:hypothetical protein